MPTRSQGELLQTLAILGLEMKVGEGSGGDAKKEASPNRRQETGGISMVSRHLHHPLRHME